MITENKHRDNKRNHGGLINDIQQNRGLDADYIETESDAHDDVGKPVDNGGVESTDLEPRLEEQWHAVRDEFLSHYPDLENVDIQYDEGKFNTVIHRLAEKKQSTPKKIQHEILNWTSKGK